MILQVSLGAASVLTRLAVLPTTVHLLVGALLLATLLVLSVRVFHTSRREVDAMTGVATTAEGLT